MKWAGRLTPKTAARPNHSQGTEPAVRWAVRRPGRTTAATHQRQTAIPATGSLTTNPAATGPPDANRPQWIRATREDTLTMPVDHTRWWVSLIHPLLRNL